MKFKNFLLAEQREYLSHKIGDVLTSVHELVAGGKQIGARQLVRHSEGVANQIRRILHSSWPKTEYKHLRVLQKCGVALMKTIEENGDLRETLNGVRQEIEQLSQKLGSPINSLGVNQDAAPPKPQQPEPAQEEAPDMSAAPPTGG
jgi:hypothetical protein